MDERPREASKEGLDAPEINQSYSRHFLFNPRGAELHSRKMTSKKIYS
jgi:hypothetical protein